MKRLGFSMLELVFVIVIMGVIGKFGVEFLSKAYTSFISAKTNHQLQANSAMSVELIAARLQYRIKDSIIARIPGVQFDSLAGVDDTKSDQYTVLEWIATDMEGFRGDFKPLWSGIADIDAGNENLIVSPDTNTTAIDNLIQILSDGNASINNAAIYFIDSNSDATVNYGWSGNEAYMQDQNGSMHPIQSVANIEHFAPKLAGSAWTTVSEFYKLSWTANAIALEDYNTTTGSGDLYLYTNYQPWEGDSYDDSGKNIQKNLIMENVDTFKFLSIGSIVKIQVCVKSNLVEEYSICKEKTIY